MLDYLVYIRVNPEIQRKLLHLSSRAFPAIPKI